MLHVHRLAMYLAGRSRRILQYDGGAWRGNMDEETVRKQEAIKRYPCSRLVYDILHEFMIFSED
jgi:hypothetical protein